MVIGDIKRVERLAKLVASQLQNGEVKSADDWQDVADDLKRAAESAQFEANRLFEEEYLAGKERTNDE